MIKNVNLYYNNPFIDIHRYTFAFFLKGALVTISGH